MKKKLKEEDLNWETTGTYIRSEFGLCTGHGASNINHDFIHIAPLQQKQIDAE